MGERNDQYLNKQLKHAYSNLGTSLICHPNLNRVFVPIIGKQFPWCYTFQLLWHGYVHGFLASLETFFTTSNLYVTSSKIGTFVQIFVAFLLFLNFNHWFRNHSDSFRNFKGPIFHKNSLLVSICLFWTLGLFKTLKLERSMDERNDRPHDLCSSIIFVRNWNACDSTAAACALVCITCAGYLNSWVIASKDPKIFVL